MADGELSDEDAKALLRLRVMLCVPQQTVERAHSDICGSLFEKVTISFVLPHFIITALSVCVCLCIGQMRSALLFSQ